jgi:ABC-type glutathione transport system ATPase component
VALARALAGSPDLLLCDEVTSALDSAAGKAIVDLLARMRDRLGLGLVVVTHDPWVAARLGGEVLVLHDGRTVEAGPAAEVLTRPAQPYTAALLAAAAR